MIKAKKLKEILRNALKEAERFPDEACIEAVSSTYFVKGQTFLGTSKGFVDLESIKEDEFGDGE